MAGQAFASSLQRLSKPTDRMQDSMDALGVTFFDAQGNMKPMVTIIRELEKGMEGMTREQKAAHTANIFGIEAFKHWSVLLERGSDELENMENGLIDSTGAAAEMAKVMNDNLHGDTLKMISAAQEMALVFYEAVGPSLRKAVQWLTKVFEWLANLSPETQRLILKIVALVAVIGPVILILGKFAAAIGSIITLSSTIIGVIGKVIGVFGMFGKVAGGAVGLFARIGGAIMRFLPIIGRLASIGRLLHPVGLAITGIILLFKGLLKYFDMTPKNIIDGLVLGFTKGIPLLWEAAKNMGMAIINKFKEILGIQSPSTVFYDFGVWIIEGLINGINAMVQFVVDLFVRLVETITEIIVNFVTWIINKMIEMKDRVVEKVTEMVTNVINKFREMVQGAIKAGKEIVSAIVGAFQNAWNGAKEFVNKAASLGVDFAKGIANGITSGAKWIKDAVIGIGKSAVNAFKNFFDIQSPSRVMAKEAEWIPAGIAKGIKSGERKATGTLVKLGERMNAGYKRINDNAKKQAKRTTDNLKRYYDQATGMMRYVAQPIKRASNAMKPRPMVAAAVAQPRGGKGNLGKSIGSVNVNVRRLENVNNRTIQNKVERGFFIGARQRE